MSGPLYRVELRASGVEDAPAATLVDDLLEAIERIVHHAEENGIDLRLDDRGLTGALPTLRERFAALADRQPEPEGLLPITAASHVYRAVRRPVGFSTLPEGIEEWAFVHRPETREGGRYGVIVTSRALTVDECDRFDLTPGGA